MVSPRLSADAHGAFEVTLGPAVMAAPFALGLGEAAIAAGVVLGAILLGLGLSAAGDRRPVPLSAHAGMDYALAAAAIAAGVAIGAGTGEALATIFLAGVGTVITALTAATRFSAPLGA